MNLISYLKRFGCTHVYDRNSILSSKWAPTNDTLNGLDRTYRRILINECRLCGKKKELIEIDFEENIKER